MAMKWMLWLLLAAIVSAKVRYDKHQVFRVVPEDQYQLQALRDLEEQSQGVIYCILASCYIRLTLNICSFVRQCNTFTS
jgi:hypothetical protein